nr:nitroreductase [Propylenella binzhouense]
MRSRRTIAAAQLKEPGPDGRTLRDILTIAARVPDHGKLAPWRFIVYENAARPGLVERLRAMAAGISDEREAARRAERARTFGEAPVVVAVVSRAAEGQKVPVWEQQLSAGAVCLNLVHACHAFGFAAQWLTGWYAYDEEAAALLGAKPGERIAGFVHIGTPSLPPAERERPDIDSLVTYWPGGPA